MSQLEKPTPPAGSDIHLPPNSAKPLILTVGTTLILLGITNFWLLIPGIIITAVTLILWIRESLQEIDELPLHHDDH